MMKRLCNWKYITIAIFTVNLMTMTYIWLRLDEDNCECQEGLPYYPFRADLNIKSRSKSVEVKNNSLLSEDRHFSQHVTVVLREFELFENDIIDTIKSFLRVDKDLNILVISDKLPYPPLHLELFEKFPGSKIKTVHLETYPHKPENNSRPELLISTEYVLVVPDSVRIKSFLEVYKMIKEHFLHSGSLIASYVSGSRIKCLSARINLRKWTLWYNDVSLKTGCDVLEGKHMLLIPTKWILELNKPFDRPCPYSLYLQTSFKNIKAWNQIRVQRKYWLWSKPTWVQEKQVHVMPTLVFEEGKQLLVDTHNRQKHDGLITQRMTKLYNRWGIKKVVHANGKVNWYGCNKMSTRCFGTVIDDMPEYLYGGRWTPPCCLENLKETARHVFRILEKCGVRYWLEGGSLLGAARDGDIIPWDYDVDIGIYKEDITKCEWLKNSQHQSIIDSNGFVWEKAMEGDFIRVQFSQTNHLHVDIFPFYSSNGIMTKHTWFATHKQDTEFPEHYLKPLTKIRFIGTMASAPNNVKKFLDMKFGKGMLKIPQYPNQKLLKFPSR